MILAISIALTIWSTGTLVLQTHGERTAARLACVSGFAAQGLWLYFDWLTGAYGLMPLALTYGALYIRGWNRWKA